MRIKVSMISDHVPASYSFMKPRWGTFKNLQVRHTLILEMFKVMKMEDLALEMEVCEVEIKVHYLLVMYNEDTVIIDFA